MRAAQRQAVLGVVRCGTEPSSRVHARAPLVQHLLRGAININYTRLKASKDIMDATVRLGRTKGRRGGGK